MPWTYRAQMRRCCCCQPRLLLSIARAFARRPAVAAEVRYDPADKVFISLLAMPIRRPLRIKPGTRFITSTREPPTTRSPSPTLGRAKARPTKSSADLPVLLRRC